MPVITGERYCERCREVVSLSEWRPTWPETRWQAFTGEQATLDGDGRTFAEIATERAKATL